MLVFGIEDPWIWGAYVLIIAITLISVIYGVLKWNSED